MIRAGISSPSSFPVEDRVRIGAGLGLGGHLGWSVGRVGDDHVDRSGSGGSLGSCVAAFQVHARAGSVAVMAGQGEKDPSFAARTSGARGLSVATASAIARPVHRSTTRASRGYPRRYAPGNPMAEPAKTSVSRH